ncbi:hypothetical protein GUJ93_ZPchr0015g6747 [Zizania palustris]|uniref:Uncharacterized protein n=1 Tax=Zizania palustris TaxID=103762 RepID=A0A8J5SYP8_ZIZPA|nr:hypothetical protein GUJ93_ZPchr0015g6747 [Zizania palustris]
MTSITRSSMASSAASTWRTCMDYRARYTLAPNQPNPEGSHCSEGTPGVDAFVPLPDIAVYCNLFAVYISRAALLPCLFNRATL